MLDPAQEFVRIGMFALLATIFKAPGMRAPYRWITDNLESAYANVVAGGCVLERDLVMWYLSLAAMGVIGTEAEWLRGAWACWVGEVGWVEMKEGVGRVMWIECIHDGPGMLACERLRVRMDGGLEMGMGDFGLEGLLIA